MQAKIPELDVERADLTSLDVGQIGIGPITVGELVIQDVDFRLSAGLGIIRGMTVTLRLHIEFEWAIHIPLPWPFDDIDIGDTNDLGTYAFSLPPVGDVTITGLSNLNISIPSITAHNVNASANPLTNVRLNNAFAEQVAAHDATLPSAGFTFAGLSLNSFEGENISLPAASVPQAIIARVHGDPLDVSEVSLNGVTLGSTAIPTVRSTSPFDVPADLQSRRLEFDMGILTFALIITPSAIAHIPFLEISNSNASATIGRVVVRNVTLPFDVLNLTLSQIGINSVRIPAFNAS
jgi:hypothetical protein